MAGLNSVSLSAAPRLPTISSTSTAPLLPRKAHWLKPDGGPLWIDWAWFVD